MDTTTVGILSDKSIFPEIIKMLIPGIFTFIAAYLAFRYGLKKDLVSEKKRLRKLKFFLHFSVSELIKSSEIQLQYINEFKMQFKSDEIDIKPIQLSSPFDDNNFYWIPKLDIYEIFINVTKRTLEEKSKAFNNLKFCLKVTKQISENLESTMNKYRFRINELGSIYNKICSEVRIEINEIIKRNIDLKFIDEFNSLKKGKLKKEKLTDFNYMYGEFYMPLLNLSEKHKIFSLIQIIPELKNINAQMQGTKTQYFEIYDGFSKQICLSIQELKKIKEFLEN